MFDFIKRRKSKTQEFRANREAVAHRKAYDYLRQLGYPSTGPAIALLEHARYCKRRAAHFANQISGL